MEGRGVLGGIGGRIRIAVHEAVLENLPAEYLRDKLRDAPRLKTHAGVPQVPSDIRPDHFVIHHAGPDLVILPLRHRHLHTHLVLTAHTTWPTWIPNLPQGLRFPFT